MFLKAATILLASFFLVSCAPKSILPASSTMPQCKPDKKFKPLFAHVTIDGIVSLTDAEARYHYDLKNENWVCNQPKSQIINSFDAADALFIHSVLIDGTRKINDILETRMEFDSKKNLRLFVSEQCTLLGMSYLFEVEGAPNDIIYGCQINPQVNSAVMWKKTINKSFIELAYLPLYQPFINKILPPK